MRQLKSCGVLCFRDRPQKQFLLMLRHPRGYDLPKGHIEEGETEIDCALRELWEETGITAEQITLDPEFRFTITYYPRYKRFNNEKVEKTTVIYIGRLTEQIEVKTADEHKGHQWFDWVPGQEIQKRTVDDLLRAVEEFWEKHPSRHY